MLLPMLFSSFNKLIYTHGPERPRRVEQAFCYKQKVTSMFNGVLSTLSGWNFLWKWRGNLKSLSFLLLHTFVLKYNFKLFLFLIMELSMKYMKNEFLHHWWCNKLNNVLLIESCFIVTFYWKHIKYTTSKFCRNELF